MSYLIIAIVIAFAACIDGSFLCFIWALLIAFYGIHEIQTEEHTIENVKRYDVEQIKIIQESDTTYLYNINYTK